MNKENLIASVMKYKYYVVFIVSFILYFQVVFFGFVKLDDIAIIEKKQEILANIENIGQCFTSDAFLRDKGSFYRPLQTLTFMIESQIAGDEPWLFHLTNLLLHAINSALVLWMFVVLGFDEKKSLILSLIFAVHPLFTHAVAWVPSRNDLMLVFFIIPSFVMYLKYIRSGKNKYLIYHALFFLLSVFTKETAMAFPGACVVYYFLVFRKKSRKKEQILSKRNLNTLGIWTGILLLVVYARVETIGIDWKSEEFGIGSLMQNILIVPEIFAKFIAPYDQPVLSNFDIITSIIGMVAILGLILWLFLAKNKNWGMIVFGLTWFLLFILPGSMYRHSYADFFYDYLDHRAYLPMIGIFLFLNTMIKPKTLDLKKKYIAIVLLLIIGGLSALSVRQSSHYQDPIRFWFKAIQDNPYKAGFYLSLGKSLINKDKYKTAQKVLLRGIRLMPQEKNFYLYLGEINFKLKEFDKSVKYLNQYLNINPDDPDILRNLGGAYANLGDFDKALNIWMNSLDKFDDPKLRNSFLLNIISVYSNLNNIEQEYKYSKMLELNQKTVKTFYNSAIRYGEYLMQRKRVDKAIEVTQEAVEVMPNNWQAYYNLGNMYATKGEVDKAVSSWNKAVELAPRVINAYQSLYRLYTEVVPDKKKAEYYKRKIQELNNR